ncbi:hypothetical protein FNV43_RR10285 [Rhamnella rubrinervis]|uniref:SGNH hydrolase-type esterase domain-containing protein n=1 Tax=Rhamnella rubrinervis TaxID=2594499 RepID=A0A8K0MKK0_9ROSA|nr:hypothetical protein FNV43_RR10285 [Rhamnella rubrinervis]
MVGPVRHQFVLFGSSIVEFSFGGGGWGATLADLYSRQADILLRGYAGWNSRRALQVLEQVFPKDAAVQPSLVIVYFGGNDSMEPNPRGLGQHVPLPEYVENMRKIAIHLKSLSEKTRIIFLTAPPVNEDHMRERLECLGLKLNRTNESCRVYSEACVELCNEMGIKAINMWTAIQKGKDWRTTCFTDGVHLSAEGSKIVVKEILKVLKEANWEPSLHYMSLLPEFGEDSPYDPISADGMTTSREFVPSHQCLDAAQLFLCPSQVVFEPNADAPSKGPHDYPSRAVIRLVQTNPMGLAILSPWAWSAQPDGNFAYTPVLIKTEIPSINKQSDVPYLGERYDLPSHAELSALWSLEKADSFHEGWICFMRLLSKLGSYSHSTASLIWCLITSTNYWRYLMGHIVLSEKRDRQIDMATFLHFLYMKPSEEGREGLFGSVVTFESEVHSIWTNEDPPIAIPVNKSPFLKKCKRFIPIRAKEKKKQTNLVLGVKDSSIVRTDTALVSLIVDSLMTRHNCSILKGLSFEEINLDTEQCALKADNAYKKKAEKICIILKHATVEVTNRAKQLEKKWFESNLKLVERGKELEALRLDFTKIEWATPGPSDEDDCSDAEEISSSEDELNEKPKTSRKSLSLTIQPTTPDPDLAASLDLNKTILEDSFDEAMCLIRIYLVRTPNGYRTRRTISLPDGCPYSCKAISPQSGDIHNSVRVFPSEVELFRIQLLSVLKHLARHKISHSVLSKTNLGVIIFGNALLTQLGHSLKGAKTKRYA